MVSASGSEDDEGSANGEQEDHSTNESAHRICSETAGHKRPDIVECSTSPPDDDMPGPVPTVLHPPLPRTTYREPCYIPPLPTVSAANAISVPHPKRIPFPNSGQPQRMFIPKPQLTVSHHKSMKQRNAGLFADKPQPFLTALHSDPRRAPDNGEVDVDAFVYDYVPRTASKRALTGSGMPRVRIPLESDTKRDVVIDVFPMPKNGIGDSLGHIDQTLGIPVPSEAGPGVMRTNLPRHPLMNPLGQQAMKMQYTQQHQQQQQLKTENHQMPRPPQVVHQYPLISGQIPAVNNGTGGGGAEMFSMIMAQPSRFNDGPPVVQPSAMATGGAAGGGNGGLGGGSGAGTSSNSSKSSGEKHKVKFSETITVAVLPEIPRKENKMDRMKGARGGGVGLTSGAINGRMRYTDPKRELAESLPLCHPNEDYLKDFQPARSK